jgi:hypothetical protein
MTRLFEDLSSQIPTVSLPHPKERIFIGNDALLEKMSDLLQFQFSTIMHGLIKWNFML